MPEVGIFGYNTPQAERMTGPNRLWLELGAILLAGLSLRLWGLSFGLPGELSRPDETVLVHKALAMGTGDLNPHFFNYPTFHLYVLALFYGAYFVGGWAGGIFGGLEDFERLYFADSSSFHLIGRMASALLGTASIGLAYALGERLGGRSAGLWSALFVALAFLPVRESHFSTVDAPATFYMLASCLFCLRYLGQNRKRELVLASALMGLATSTKYSLGLFSPVVLMTGVLGKGGTRSRWSRLLAGAGIMAMAFVAGSPYALLDFPAFWADLSYERQHFAAGHAGMDLGRGWWHHLHFSLPYGMGWPLLVASLAGCLRWAWQRRKPELVLLAGLLFYCGVAGSGKGVFMRYALPLVPLLCVAAGTGLAAWVRPWPARWVLGILLVAPTAHASWQFDRLLARTDARVLAAVWIEENVPHGARIALHGGSDYGQPPLRPSRESLRERLEALQASGLPAKRLKRLLDLEGYTSGPSYELVELRAANPLGRRAIWTEYSAARLREAGIEWVVLHDHPHLEYSRPDSAFAAQVEREAELAWHCDPFTGKGEELVYDPLDAFYVPVSGFGGVERPGPKIRVYRLSGTVSERQG
jgi:4-amino-4-deoxy-L-arabinose transferase-like glycosyltransferase